MRQVMLAICVALLLGSSIQASDLDEFRVKRTGPFEFAQRPVVTRNGDRVTITFETKTFCDVTVAIEEAFAGGLARRGETGTGPSAEKGPGPLTSGDRVPFPRVVRHLASGVLGPNAPEPFQKNSKKQVIVWDGKDDKGVYLDEKDRLTVRVSLGLKPRFERTLYWNPHKRISRNMPPLVVAQPEGVYVFEGAGRDTLRFLGHDGTYRRMVYPFPAENLPKVEGLKWAVFPQDSLKPSPEPSKIPDTLSVTLERDPIRYLREGQRMLPLKHGLVQATFLTSGKNTGDGTLAKYQPGATAMAIGGGRVYLASLKLNRLATDGTTGGQHLTGPSVAIEVPKNVRAQVPVSEPRSIALSPDGKTLYLTGYVFLRPYPRPPGEYHCVLKMDPTKDEPPTLFAGSLKADDKGSDNAHFKVPLAVDCDAQGRVYVADYMNDRIQVFQPDGTFYKTVTIKKPTQIAVHKRTGAIYVFSWQFINRYSQPLDVETPTYTRLGPVDDPQVKATCELPLVGHHNKVFMNKRKGYQHAAYVDSYTDPPTIWLVPGTPGDFAKLAMVRGKLTKHAAEAHLRILVERDGRLVSKRDFGPEVAKAVLRTSPAPHARQRLYVNPVTGRLYVAEGQAGVSKSYLSFLEIDPETGRLREFPLPFDAEDAAFDLDGRLYLRTENVVACYDPTDMTEIPFGYGEVRRSVGFSASRDGTRAFVRSGIIMPSQKPGCFHQGGMWVAPNGHIVVSCYNRARDRDRREASEIERAYASGEGRSYTPTLYPGRVRWGEVHIWDDRGRLLYEDALPGLPMLDGIALDRHDNIYVLASPNRILDGTPYFLERNETLVKARPMTAKLVNSRDKRVPMPLPKEARPKRSADLDRGGAYWVEGAQWMYGGVGFGGFNSAKGGGGCACWHARFTLDAYARPFAPEVDHFSVAVLDTAGNLITRIGRYGNVDDGVPLVSVPSSVPEKGTDPLAAETGTGTSQRLGASPRFRSIGGDEVALMDAAYVAVHSDRRLFIADGGNGRILSVKLEYQTNERVALKTVADEGD